MSSLRARLIPVLKVAHEIACTYEGGWSEHFVSSEEFAGALGTALGKFESGDVSQVDQMVGWFVITGDWDDLIGGYAYFAQELFNMLCEYKDLKDKFA
jgi:hypothetical protein